jgi:site-specific recombinase XerD
MKTRRKRTESAAVRAEIRVWMARRGVSGAQLADALGHASPATTARYTKVESSELSDAVESLPRIA